jgi:agmatine deiminase
VWLGRGSDPYTDRHIDGIVQYLASAKVVLLVPGDPSDPDHASGSDNLERLRRARDARGREFEVVPFETRPPGHVPYLNFYLPNGGVVVPVADRPEDEQALEQITRLFPDREVVAVPGNCLWYGGGGPHCITQQVPRGARRRARFTADLGAGGSSPRRGRGRPIHKLSAWRYRRSTYRNVGV